MTGLAKLKQIDGDKKREKGKTGRFDEKYFDFRKMQIEDYLYKTNLHFHLSEDIGTCWIYMC